MYEGQIVRVSKITPIKGKDRIVAATLSIGSIAVAEVVTSKDSQVGDVGVFFGADIQLSKEYCEKNNLIRNVVDGVNIGGYLDENRRVITEKFAGVKSEGLFMSLATLPKRNYSEGDLVGEPIAKRYPKPERVTQETKTKQRTWINKIFGRWLSRNAPEYNFPVVGSTEHLTQNTRTIENMDHGLEVTITEKLHGTSHRFGRVEVTVHLGAYQRFVNAIAGHPVYKNTRMETVHGSRTVILTPHSTGYYGSNQFRYDAINAGTPDNLEDNEIIYGEIVGYAGSDKLIMNTHDTAEMKSVVKAFGNPMAYTYGQEKGACKFYVYAIKRWNGVVWETLSYTAMVHRAFELGYDCVPLLDMFTWDGDITALMEKVTKHTQPNGEWNKSQLGDHISEGVVVSINGRNFKHKSFAFRLFEGHAYLPELEDQS